jgi:hypothetical protein
MFEATTASIDKILQTFYSLSRVKSYSKNQIFESFSTHFQKLNGANCFLTGKIIVLFFWSDCKKFIYFKIKTNISCPAS